MPILVIKRDGRRERYDRKKLRNGIIKAVGKTTISAIQVDEIVNAISSTISEVENGEVESQQIGSFVAQHLKKLDKIAYIRFASVFKRFVEVEEFEKELKKLL